MKNSTRTMAAGIRTTPGGKEHPMELYAVEFYASTVIGVPSGMEPKDYIDNNWEKVTGQAIRYLLDEGEYELYEIGKVTE